MIAAAKCARVLRADRFQLPSLAARTDRAMRALLARATASSVYTSVAECLRRLPANGNPQIAMISILESRAGWRRRDEREFVHAFGHRHCAITFPVRFDTPSFAALVVRAEINNLLGDCDWPLLTHLQALAVSELQRLAKS